MANRGTILDSNKLEIFGYTDYRSYLKDYYLFKKGRTHGFSYRMFSKQAGFKSPNFLKLVIDGKRNLTSESGLLVSKAIGFDEKRSLYFKKLIDLEKCTDDSKKAELLVNLKKMIPSDFQKLDLDLLDYLDSWLKPVLREMVEAGDFKADPYWLSRKLTGRINLKDLVSTVDYLVEKGFVISKDREHFQVKEKMILSSDEIKSLAIRRFHRIILNQAQEMLEDLPMEQREYGALTFSLSEDCFEELKDKLKGFRHEIHEWAVKSQTDKEAKKRIVQLNFQMYPQTVK